jgi:hypothetical protein
MTKTVQNVYVPRPVSGTAGNQWWLRGDVRPSECLAAFQPLGQQSIATSLFNINNPGINNAAIGTTPTFSKATGWTFAAASSQYLTVGSGALATAVPISMVCLFQADNVTSAYPLMSISRAATTNEQWVLEAGGATSSDPIRAVSTAAGTVKAAVSAVGYAADTWAVGVAVFATAALRNAHIFTKNNIRTADVHYGNWGTETTSNTPATSVDTTSIGYTSDASTPTYHGGKIGGCALYKIALNQEQVVEIARALLELV